MAVMITKVNSRNQIAIPKSTCEKLNIKAGDRLLLDVQNGMLVLIPQPKSYTNHLQGLHAEICKDVDAQECVNGERKAW